MFFCIILLCENMDTKDEKIGYFMSILTPIDGFDKLAAPNGINPAFFVRHCYFFSGFHESFCG